MQCLKNDRKIEPEFESMLSVANEYFATTDSEKYEYHQCLVLSTAQGERMTYPIKSDSVQDLINQSCTILLQLEKEERTAIRKIICMWEGNTIDVPSFQFMKTLCEINPENRIAEILLKGSNTYNIKKIVDIIG